MRKNRPLNRKKREFEDQIDLVKCQCEALQKTISGLLHTRLQHAEVKQLFAYVSEQSGVDISVAFRECCTHHVTGLFWRYRLQTAYEMVAFFDYEFDFELLKHFRDGLARKPLFLEHVRWELRHRVHHRKYELAWDIVTPLKRHFECDLSAELQSMFKEVMPRARIHFAVAGE